MDCIGGPGAETGGFDGGFSGSVWTSLDIDGRGSRLIIFLSFGGRWFPRKITKGGVRVTLRQIFQALAGGRRRRFRPVNLVYRTRTLRNFGNWWNCGCSRVFPQANRFGCPFRLLSRGGLAFHWSVESSSDAHPPVMGAASAALGVHFRLLFSLDTVRLYLW